MFQKLFIVSSLSEDSTTISILPRFRIMTTSSSPSLPSAHFESPNPTSDHSVVGRHQELSVHVTNDVYFAVVGDVHGQFFLTRRLLQELEHRLLQETATKLDFVLQVGDLECHRDEEDMATMAAPAAKRRLGDFRECCLDGHPWPWPTYFIGGNHECFGWLDAPRRAVPRASSNGSQTGLVRDSRTGPVWEPFEVAPNLFYLGRAGYLPIRVFSEKNAQESTSKKSEGEEDLLQESTTASGSSVPRAVLHVGFLSGIHRPENYFHRRPEATPENFATHSNKAWIGFNCYDTNLLLWDEEDAGIEMHAVEDGSEEEASRGPLESVPSQDHLIFRERLEQRFRKVLMISCGEDVVLEQDPELSPAELRFLLGFVVEPQFGGRQFGRGGGGRGGGGAEGQSGISRPNDAQQIDAAEARIRSEISAVAPLLRLSALLEFFTSDRMLASQFSNPQRQQRFLSRFVRRKNCDVFITHDWPSGIFADELGGDAAGLRGSRPMGNPVARELLDALRPKLHVCGHMHRAYRAKVVRQHNDRPEKTTAPVGERAGEAGSSNGRAEHELSSHSSTDVCCVSKVGMSLCIALFRYDPRTGEITEIRRPAASEIARNLGIIGEGSEEESSEGSEGEHQHEY